MNIFYAFVNKEFIGTLYSMATDYYTQKNLELQNYGKKKTAICQKKHEKLCFQLKYCNTLKNFITKYKIFVIFKKKCVSKSEIYYLQLNYLSTY